MNELKPKINSLYVTKSGQDKPVLIVPVTEKGLKIDLHIQYVNFTLAQHTVLVSITDKTGHEYLDGKPNIFDFSDAKILTEANTAISEIVLFCQMSKSESYNLSYFNINVKIDDELEADTMLFLDRGDVTNG